METINRRHFLKTAGGVVLGTVALSSLAGTALSCAQKASSSPTLAPAPAATLVPPPPQPTATPVKLEIPPAPWSYKKIDPVAAAERGYAAYYNGGCMFGAFEGIIGELRTAGFPFDTFPTTMMKYGAGGVSGWGTLCGALNGGAALIFLVSDPKVGNPIINELYSWYATEALPNYKPKTPKFDIISSVAESQLCHASVTKWCDKSGFKALSPERAERCAWVTASVAKYTVELLNAQADTTFKIAHPIPTAVTECLSCHGKGGVVENVHMSNNNSCFSCHEDIKAKHPIPLKS